MTQSRYHLLLVNNWSNWHKDEINFNHFLFSLELENVIFFVLWVNHPLAIQHATERQKIWSKNCLCLSLSHTLSLSLSLSLAFENVYSSLLFTWCRGKKREREGEGGREGFFLLCLKNCTKLGLSKVLEISIRKAKSR